MAAHKKSDYAKQRQRFDTNPRFRIENVVNLDLDTHERTTRDYQACHGMPCAAGLGVGGGGGGVISCRRHSVPCLLLRFASSRSLLRDAHSAAGLYFSLRWRQADMGARVQEALDMALQGEEDEEIGGHDYYEHDDGRQSARGYNRY